MLVIDDSGSIVNNHSDIFFDKKTFHSKTFFIKNQGQILLKLIGLPFIRLSSEILQETDYRSQLSFSSINGVFIAPLNQPKKSVLFAQDAAMFTLSTTGKFELSDNPVQFIVSIPTNYYLYNPFWFKMILR